MVTKNYNADIEAILAKRYDNGGDYWATADGRLLVGDPFSTITALLILHELPVPRTHEAVLGAVNLLFKAWREDGRFRIAPIGTMYPCHTALIAAILGRFGYAYDHRLNQTLSFLLKSPHYDGGWRCNRRPMGRSVETDCSNPGVTLFVLDAFRFTQLAKKNSISNCGVDSLLKHWEVRRPTGPCEFGIGTQFMQVEFPFLRYNLFYYVYVLSFYNRAVKDYRFLESLDTLKSKLDKHGQVIVERPHRKLRLFMFCAKGQPSELATRRYREIEKNIEGHLN